MRYKEANLRTTATNMAATINWSSFYRILITVIFLGIAFDNMDQVTCSFILPMMRMEWNLNYTQGSYMGSIAALGALIGAIFWGMVADRVGRRTALIWTILLYTLTNLIQTHAWSYPQFTITCFVMGFGVGGEIPLAFTMLLEFLPARSRTVTAIAVGVLAIVAGYAFAAISAHFLLPLFDWKSLFYVQALPALLVLVVRFQLPESPRYLRSIGQEEAAQQAASEVEQRTGGYNPLRDSGEGLQVVGSRQSLLEGLRTLWRGLYLRRTITNWVFGFCIGFFNFGFIVWLPTTLQNLGYTQAQSVNYPLLINFFAFPSIFAIFFLLRRGGSKLVLTVYPCVAGILMLAMGYFLPQIASQPLFLVLIGGGIFFFGTTLLGIFPPYSSEIYPTEVRGTGSGWSAGFSRAGAFLGPLVGGILLDRGISEQSLIVFYGFPLLIAALVMFAFGVQTYLLTLEKISPSFGHVTAGSAIEKEPTH
jgi:putative MFS transporter